MPRDGERLNGSVLSISAKFDVAAALGVNVET
jgi:hypothetical protein